MFTPTAAFPSFSVPDLDKAQAFYRDTLGLSAEIDKMGLRLALPGGVVVVAYAKPDHQPASFTILNFQVDDLKAAMADLTAKGMTFEQYAGMTDEDGVARGIANHQGPDIAWFKDPFGNILSVLQEA